MKRGKFKLEVKEAGSIFLNIELAWREFWYFYEYCDCSENKDIRKIFIFGTFRKAL